MSKPASQPDDYLLGHSQDEEERLRRLPRELAPDSNQFLDRLGIQPGDRAVDIGCGPQGILDLLSDKVGPTGRVIGVERNESTAQLGQQFVFEHQFRNVQVLHGDAKATGLPRASFDLVHARLVFVNAPEPQRVLDEMVALVRPGGTVASQEVDWGMSLCHPPSPAWDRLLGVFEAYSRSQGVDLCIGRKTYQMFRSVGLVDVEVTPVIHSYGLGSSLRNILFHLLESVRDGLVKHGVLTDIEFREQLTELKRHLDDADRLVIPPLFLQVSGRKPGISAPRHT